MQIIGQICAFEVPFGGLGATYDVHLRLIGKLVGDFLLVIIELFTLGAFVLSQFTRVTDRRTETFAVAKTALHICSAVKMVQIFMVYSVHTAHSPATWRMEQGRQTVRERENRETAHRKQK